MKQRKAVSAGSQPSGGDRSANRDRAATGPPDSFVIGTDWQTWRPTRSRTTLVLALATLAAWVSFLAWMMLTR